MLFPQIEELATTGIVSVREDVPVSTVLQQMARCKLHTIVVEEGVVDVEDNSPDHSPKLEVRSSNSDSSSHP